MTPFQGFSLPFLFSSLLATQSQEDARALLLKGRSLQRRGGGEDPAAAVQLYKRVIALEPKSGEAHLRLSEALVEIGQNDSALSAAKQAVQWAPKNGEAWAHLGILAQTHGRKNTELMQEAKSALKQASTLLPGDAEIWTRYGEVAEGLQDEEAALHAWIHVGRLQPLLNVQGKLLGDLAWEKAISLAEKRKDYDIRREAIMALCNRPHPEAKHLGLLEDLAREQADKGFLGHAEESFALLGNHLPEVPALWENIAILQMRTARFEEALQTFLKAENLRRHPRISYNIGWCLLNLGRLQESEGRWQEVLGSPLGVSQEDIALKRDTTRLLGTVFILENRPQEALSFLSKESETPNSPDLLTIKALALLKLQQWKPALQIIKQGMVRFPEKGIFYLAKNLPPRHIDDSFFNKKRIRKTLALLDLEMTATYNADFRRWKTCLTLLQEAKKLEPTRSIDVVLLHGNALQELGYMEAAIEVLKEGQKLKPDHPMLQNNLGYLMLEHGENLQEAAQLIESALKRDPDNASTMDSWGWALFKLGQFEKAEVALRKATERAPYSPETRKHLGEALLTLKRDEEALEQWERALAFAFPERKALEERVRALRLKLAKRKHEAQVPIPDPTDASPEPFEESL